MNELRKARIEIGLLFLLLLYILPAKHSETDFGYWLDWALIIHDHGLTNMYEHGVMYHPVIPYFIWLYDLLMGTRENIITNINALKIFPLLFDFLPLVVLCCFRQKLVEEKIPYLFMLLNIAYLFNSLIWGQMDSTYAALCFLAMLTALRNPVLSVVLLTVSFLTKFQTVMFFPIMGMLLFYRVRDIKTLIKAVCASLITTIILLFPFILAGKLHQVFAVTTGTVDYMKHVSVQAYNIWFLLIRGIPFDVMDDSTFFILTYKQTGLLLFSIASLFIYIPLVKKIFHLRRMKLDADRSFKEMLMITSGLAAFCFFYFNTQMHERYIHAALLLFFFYGVYSRNYWPYLLVSIPYLLSLEKTLPEFLPIKHYRIIFSARVIALWYTAVLIYTMSVFYRRYWKRADG